ncbi:hypothetical protein ABT075_46355 [Streptomyces sp. NPDC002677]|uniref:hypothetical protein n=1 Tax=Streptomyces sp. NPDC002677 TaxID=3154774 RepID=UPI003334304C
MTGAGADLAIRPPEQLKIFIRTRPEILPDEHSTTGKHFEVVVVPPGPVGRIGAALTVSGTLRTDSVLVAEHRKPRGARADRFKAAVEITEARWKSCPSQVAIQDNRSVDGLGPFADGMHATSGPECRGAVTEVSVGTGGLSADRVDRSPNCLLGEGAAGVRPGVGDGLAGKHFGVISRDARLDAL